MNDNIAKRAYELWEKAGKPHGRHNEHWLQAEAELLKKPVHSDAPIAAPKPVGPEKSAPKPKGKKGAQ